MNIKTTLFILGGFAAGYFIANQMAKKKAEKEAEKAPEEKSGADAKKCGCQSKGLPSNRNLIRPTGKKCILAQRGGEIVYGNQYEVFVDGQWTTQCYY